MLAINATIHLQSAPTPTVAHYEESNDCYSLLLSGNYHTPFVSIYGTYEQITEFLRAAQQAVVAAHAFGVDAPAVTHVA